jgi:hypothetical protein
VPRPPPSARPNGAGLPRAILVTSIARGRRRLDESSFPVATTATYFWVDQESKRDCFAAILKKHRGRDRARVEKREGARS